MRNDATPRVLADFAGTWRIERRITHADGTTARFEGVAVWSDDALGLSYRETGTLKMPGALEMQAERRYLWGPELDVYFEDGRFFHRVPSLGGETDHWCSPDTYKGHYDFGQWPRFSTTWQVAGPKKSYSMHSLYHRC